MNIVIVDYGMGNQGSILKMFNYLNIEAIVSDKASDIELAKKIVLPGVGSFDHGITNIKKLGLEGVLNKKVLVDKTPILGICLGMQLMTSFSEEGTLEGLNWIKAKTTHFKPVIAENIRVPHMGWNFIIKKAEHPFTLGLDNLSKFYFIHSYFVTCENENDSICKSYYSCEFDSIIGKENIFGCQFHPEKSHKYGMKLLHNFAQ